MEDTLKTTALGVTSSGVIGLGILPDIVSVMVGVVTIVYFIMKIKNEFKN
jgi:hypothetical protein